MRSRCAWLQICVGHLLVLCCRHGFCDAMPEEIESIDELEFNFMDGEIDEETRDYLIEQLDVYGPPQAGKRIGALALSSLWKIGSSEASTWLTGRFNAPKRITVGFTIAARPKYGLAQSAGFGQPILLPGRKIRFDPVEAYVTQVDDRLSWIAGSYRIGFGQRLTFDTTGYRWPDGFVPGTRVSDSIISGSMSYTKTLLGAAVRYRRQWDATAFVSYNLDNIHVNHFDYDRCPASKPQCKASQKMPKVQNKETGDGFSCESPTLPWAVHEALGGASIGYHFQNHVFLGITGYGAWRQFRVRGEHIQHTRSSKYPWDRGFFGAVGLNGAFSKGIVDGGFEITSTDRGALAGLILVNIKPLSKLEITPSFRYYSPNYDNPYSRGTADPDEFQGIRGRDEIGGRLELDWKASQLIAIGSRLDVWHHRHDKCDETAQPGDPGWCARPLGFFNAGPIKQSTDLELIFKTLISFSQHETARLRLVYHDENLAKSGRNLSYSPHINSQGDWSGGAKIYWSVRFATKRIPRTRLALSFRQIFEDIYALKDKFDHSWSTNLNVRIDASPGPKLWIRLGYRDDSTTTLPIRHANQICGSWDTDGPLPEWLPGQCRGETSISVYLKGSQRLLTWSSGDLDLQLTGNWIRWLDDRLLFTKTTNCGPPPSRNSFSLRAAISTSF